MKQLRDPAFWQRVRESEDYAQYRRLIEKHYRESRFDGDIPEISFRTRIRFEIDGDRDEFAGVYFRRRHAMTYTALMAMIYPEEPRYIEELQEIMWAVCGEFSWILPAHARFSPGDDNDYIDLKAPDTAFTMAEICLLLGDRLHPKIRKRVRDEAGRRILDVFKRGHQNWEDAENNWSSVIGCYTAATILYLFPEEFDAALERIRSVAFESFFRSYSEEGTCFEGLGYWHYGFGTFVWFADLLLEYTEGKIDLLAGDKVRNMVGFGRRCFLRGNTIISFSDCERHGSLNPGLMAYLQKRFPEHVKPVPAWMMPIPETPQNWLELTRSMLYLDPNPAEGTFEPESMDLPDSGQVLIGTKTYSLAVRAGDNNVHVSHCDVGNFIFSTDEGQILCDMGVGRYTKDYHDPNLRRSFFCIGSQGHNVPILNGETQKQGEEYRGTIRHTGSRIELEISGAYGLESIRRFDRVFTHTEEEVILTDSFAPDYDSITERFTTLLRPTVENGTVRIGASRLEYDPALAPIIQPHTADLPGGMETIWTVDFDLPRGLDHVTFVLRP